LQWTGCESNPQPLDYESDTLPLHHCTHCTKSPVIDPAQQCIRSLIHSPLTGVATSRNEAAIRSLSAGLVSARRSRNDDVLTQPAATKTTSRETEKLQRHEMSPRQCRRCWETSRSTSVVSQLLLLLLQLKEATQRADHHTYRCLPRIHSRHENRPPLEMLPPGAHNFPTKRKKMNLH